MTEAHMYPPHEVGIYAAVVVLLVIGAGLMSGLTLGLLSLDVMDLEVLRVSGSSKERRAAGRLIPLVSSPHWLLCTLLLCNAGCMEALPIFLDKLIDPLGAILISVTAILVFGEIIPQAVCSRYGVAIGAALAPLVRGLMWLCSPITWPLGKLLDCVLGHEEVVMKRRQLKAMVALHGEGAGLGGNLTHQEVNVIQGALELTGKTAGGAMTPMSKVFMLSDAALLDKQLVMEVLQRGHSRVPVYRGNDRQDVVGLILVKEIIKFWRCEQEPLVGHLRLRPLPQLSWQTPMFDVMRLFQTGRSHMALLMAPESANVEDLRRRSLLPMADDETSSSSSSSSSSASSSTGSSCSGTDGEASPSTSPHVRFRRTSLGQQQQQHEGSSRRSRHRMRSSKRPDSRASNSRVRPEGSREGSRGNSITGLEGEDNDGGGSSRRPKSRSKMRDLITRLSSRGRRGSGGKGEVEMVLPEVHHRNGAPAVAPEESLAIDMPLLSVEAVEEELAQGQEGQLGQTGGLKKMGSSCDIEEAVAANGSTGGIVSHGAGLFKHSSSGNLLGQLRGRSVSMGATDLEAGGLLEPLNAAAAVRPGSAGSAPPALGSSTCTAAAALDASDGNDSKKMQKNRTSSQGSSRGKQRRRKHAGSGGTTEDAEVSAEAAAEQVAVAAEGGVSKKGAGASGDNLVHQHHHHQHQQQQQQEEVQARRQESQVSAGESAAASVAPAVTAAALVTAAAIAGADPEGSVRMVPVGIITLEDVIEELMKTEIVDETDAFLDNDQTEKVPDFQELLQALPPHLRGVMQAEVRQAATKLIAQQGIRRPPGALVSSRVMPTLATVAGNSNAAAASAARNDAVAQAAALL